MTASSPIYIDVEDLPDEDLPFSSELKSSGSTHYVVEDRDVGVADEYFAPSPAEVNSSKLEEKGSGLIQRTDDAGAGNGFKPRVQIVKKSGKKLLSKRCNSKGRSFLQFGSKAQDRPQTVKHFRAKLSYRFESEDGDVNMLLTKYGEIRERYRRARKKEMEALHDFRRDYWYLLCNGQESIDGHVQGIKVGMCFTWRPEMFLVSLHRKVQAGIDWIPADKSPVLENDNPVSIAVSVVVTGSFEDDVDEGESILYCGEGGRPYSGVDRGEQTANQELTRGNLALHNSARLSRSVRVIRKHRDESSPSGFLYSYDGMYKVSRSYAKRGRSGYRVYMFELNRMPNQVPL